MTKKMRENGKYYLWLYKKSNARRLEDVYKRCSDEKQSSFWRISCEMRQLGGASLRVLTHNTFRYTCAYILKNTLVVHTAENRYVFNLDELN